MPTGTNGRTLAFGGRGLRVYTGRHPIAHLHDNVSAAFPKARSSKGPVGRERSPVVRAGTRWLLSADERARLEQLRLEERGHGYDMFGANADWVKLYAALGRFLYQRYFRVISEGIEKIPSGSAILAANHSGTLPYDAAMIWMDVLHGTKPARLLRPIADTFVPRMPFVNKWLARGGTVGGSRGNVHALLEAGELLLVFPEGTPGITKPFRDRYKLRRFRVGHAEFAIRHGAPVVPLAVIGAEEQMPLLALLPVRILGAPFLPIPATPLPLPVRYHILYGDPIDFCKEYSPSDADDPRVLTAAAARVQSAVEALLRRGLRDRKGVFT